MHKAKAKAKHKVDQENKNSPSLKAKLDGCQTQIRDKAKSNTVEV